jgi:hypothetical protein
MILTSGEIYFIGVSSRQKTSGLRFSPSDAQFFSRIFAMALYAYENGIPATIKTIKNEIQQLAVEKPMLVIESTSSKLVER